MVSTVNDRFILAEETALKAKFDGLEVDDPRGGKLPVDVWFRWPNKEVREIRYPFVALDLADTVKADRREHSGGPYPLRYEPHNYEVTIPGDDGVRMAPEWPTPYDLVYTASVVSLDPRHDRQLKWSLLGDKDRLPHRWAYLLVEDGTGRRLDVVDVTSTVSRHPEKTQFFTIFTLIVETELFVGEVKDVWTAQSISVTLKELITGVTEHIYTSP